MNVLYYGLVIVRCASVVYLVRFLERQSRKMFSYSSTSGTFFNMFHKMGVWTCLLLAASVALAAPRFIGNETREDFNQDPLLSASSLFNLIDPLNWAQFSSLSSDKYSESSSPTTYLHPIELARYYGYEAEPHWVTTEDGYILGLQRLPGGKLTGVNSTNKQSSLRQRPAVVLHHAYLLSARDFLVLGPKKSLAYLLVDAGYDVWLINTRGNTYSLNHTTLSPKQADFWNFSYTESGMYDVPAVLDYVTKATGSSKVHYVGHSIGTLVFFIMGSRRPEALQKVRTFSALTPVTTTMHCRSRLLRMILNSYWPVVRAIEKTGRHEFLSHYKWITSVGQTFCRDGWITQGLCTALLNGLVGPDGGSFNKTLLPELLTYAPAGSSLKTFEHFAQNFHNGFRDFDYGAEGNLRRYSTREPPFFNLTGINVPTQMFYSYSDYMADYTDTEIMCKTMPNVFNCHAVEDHMFNHLDFMWSDTAHKVVYSKLMEGLQRYDDEAIDVPNKLT